MKLTICLFTVDDMELGRYMHNNDTSHVLPLIMKPGNAVEVKLIKHLLADMLALESSARPPIQKVVDRLSQLRASVGVHVILAVDTVWKSPVFYSKSFISTGELSIDYVCDIITMWYGWMNGVLGHVLHCQG